MFKIVVILFFGLIIPSFLLGQNDVTAIVDSITYFRQHSQWDNYHNEINRLIIDRNAVANDDSIVAIINHESQLLKERNENIEAGYVWNYAGKMYAISGIFDKAVPYYEKAIEQLSKFNDTTYLHLIHYYNSQCIILGINDPSKALESSTEALRLYKNKKDVSPQILAKLHYAKGWSYRGLNAYDKAIEAFTKSIELSKDEDGYVQTFLCRTYLEMGEYTKALESAVIANNKYEALNGVPNNEYVLLLGRANSGLNMHDEAERIIRRSIDLGRSEYDVHHSEYIKLFYFLAKAQFKAGKAEDALSSINKIFELSFPGAPNRSSSFERVVSPFPNLWVLDGLMLMGQIHMSEYEESKEPNAILSALECFNHSIQEVHLRRAELNTWTSKQEFNKYGFEAFEGAIEASYLLCKGANSVEYLNNMINYMEGSRFILLKSYQAEVAAQKNVMSPEQKSLLAALKREIAELEKEYFVAVDSSMTNEVERLNKAIIEKRKEWTQLVKPFSEYLSQNELGAQKSEVNVTDLQAKLDDSSVLIMYYELQSKVVVVTLNNVQVFVSEIENSEALSTDIFKMYKAVSDWDQIQKSFNAVSTTYDDKALILGDLLLHDLITEGLNFNKLIIMPHGNLFSIPFEVLVYNDKLVLEKAAVQYALSCDQIISSTKSIVSHTDFFGGFAPSYQSESTSPKPDELKLRGALIDLPGTRETLISLSNKFNGQVWTGKEATKEVFLKNANRFKLLHLGMHGQIHNKVSNLSKLYFSNEESSSLTVGEIQSMNLQTELVTLSACQTNVGELKEGEGPLSLAYAFLYAGSKSILSSLWSVPDHHTSEIMVSFYDYLSKGFEKSQALRMAKLDYLKSAVGIERHPSYWAGFTIIGSDYPVMNHSSKKIYIILGLILIVLLLNRNLLQRIFIK